MLVAVMSVANYDDVRKRLPPAVVTDDSGRPLASWRLAVLPFSPAGGTGPDDTHALSWAGFDPQRTWDDPANHAVASRPFSFYCYQNTKVDGPLDTNVFAITGPGTAFDPAARHRRSDLPDDTILLIEVSGTGVPWAAPGDLDVRNGSQSVTLGTHGNGFHVAFADGSVWCLRKDTPATTLEPFFRIEGARQLDREQQLGPYVIDRIDRSE